MTCGDARRIPAVEPTPAEVAPDTVLVRIDADTVVTREAVDKRSHPVHVAKLAYHAIRGDEAVKTLENVDLYLFKRDDADDWVYFCTRDFSACGWINILNYDNKNFYGDFAESAKTGNWYETRLEKEHELLAKEKDIVRHGPLLVLRSGESTYRIWDAFRGEFGPEYNLFSRRIDDRYVLLERFYFEGGAYVLFDLAGGAELTKTGNEPVFNASKDAFYAFGYLYGVDIVLEVHVKRGDSFEKALEAGLSERGDYYGAACGWTSNDAFRLSFKNGSVLSYSRASGWKAEITEPVEMP